MAEIHSAEATMGNNMSSLKDLIEEFIKGKDDKVELPQDYLLSPAAKNQVDSPRETFSSNDSDVTAVVANKHALVSPNKSDELVPLLVESSPSDDESKSKVEQSKDALDSIKELIDSFAASKRGEDLDSTAVEGKLALDFNAEYGKGYDAAHFDTNVDLSVIGKRLEIQTSAGVAAEATLHASSDSFANIIHGDKKVMLVLPSRDTCELGSILELSETLAKSLGITDEIVGLKTTARVLDDESSTFKFHGDCVLPFSALASGQLAKMIKNTDGRGEFDDEVPSFNLVTSYIESYCGYDPVQSIESKGEVYDEETISEESSSGSTREGFLHTETFLHLMEKSDDIDPFQKNALLRFGIDNPKRANILYRASFRVAVLTGNLAYFVQGLKAISDILLGANSVRASDDDADFTRKASMNISGLTDFVITADKLFECEDVTAQQHATLLDAILSGHPAVHALFDLYHCPDFLLACNADKDLAGGLCMRDMLHLAKKLEPLQPQSSATDDLLKWAIKTGIHNFSAAMSADTDVPQEFVNIIYHMFSSGDEMVLSACQKFAETNDCDVIVDMLFREWDIYCGNKAFLSEEKESFRVDSDDTSLPLPELSNPAEKVCDFPRCLLTAVGCLVEQEEMTEDAAAKILVSYAEGDHLVHDVYGHFIQFGGVDDFLRMLKLFASTEGDQLAISTGGGTENPFRCALSEMKEDGELNAIQIAALRLASSRRDSKLTRALADYSNKHTDKTLFKHSVLDVARCVIQEISETDVMA